MLLKFRWAVSTADVMIYKVMIARVIALISMLVVCCIGGRKKTSWRLIRTLKHRQLCHFASVGNSWLSHAQGGGSGGGGGWGLIDGINKFFFFYKYQIYSATLHRESADGFFFFFPSRWKDNDISVGCEFSNHSLGSRTRHFVKVFDAHALVRIWFWILNPA